MYKGFNDVVFANLDDLYKYLAADGSINYDVHLSSRVRRLSEKLVDDKQKEQCMYESYAFGFSFEGGLLKPEYTQPDGTEIPNFDLFTDDLSYLKNRAENETNPKYRAHYNHILWKNPTKDNKFVFAKAAVDSYLILLSGVTDFEDPHSGRTYGGYLNNLFHLSQETNYRKDDVIALLEKQLECSDFSNYQKSVMIKFVAQHGKNVKELLQKFYDRVTDLILKEDTQFIVDFLYLQILLAQKLGHSTSPSFEKIAEYNLTEASKNADNFVAHDYYLSAMLAYRKAGSKEKVEEVSVLVEKAKNNINLTKVDLGNNKELDEMFQALMKHYDKVTDKLIEGPYEQIYTFLTLHPLFPKADQLGKRQSTVLADLFRTMSFDSNGNLNRGKKGLAISMYHIHIQNFTWNITWMIFLKGIKCGKVSYDTFMEYLQNYSWYATDSNGTMEDGQAAAFDWIGLISPSLYQFFTQLRIDIDNKQTNKQGYILATDSLVLKFEGLIREISRKVGAQTIEVQNNGTEERISFEKLLDNPKFGALVPEDDIAYFKYLFTRDGVNIRNNVAHCFYKSDSYGPAHAVLMIVALMRLGNYEFGSDSVSG